MPKKPNGKRGLTAIRLARSIGIYLTDDKMVWTLAEKLPLGSRIAETGEQPITRTDWAAGIAAVLEQQLTGRRARSTRIVIGLPASQIFFATLPQSGKESAEALLTQHNCCSAIPAAEMCSDLVPLKVLGKPFASIAAARKKEILALTEVGRRGGSNFVRVEPAPWALLRLSGAGKASKTTLRLFVDRTELVAILARGAHPLLWRTVELSSSGAEAADAIVSLVRTFETYASQHIGFSDIAAITLQGRDMPERLAERLQAELGGNFSPIDGPGPTAQAISEGLAHGGLAWEQPALDLSKSLAPPSRLADLVPYGELALLAAAILCSSLWLWSTGNDVIDRATHAEEANARNVVLKASDSQLKNEKKALTSEVQAVSGFLTKRILWTRYVNEISARVPANVRLVQIQGDYELVCGNKKNQKKGKQDFLLDFAASLPKNVSAPPEVDEVLTALRRSPLITHDFPEMQLASLRVSKIEHRPGTARDLPDPATFTVSCAPEAKGKGKK